MHHDQIWPQALQQLPVAPLRGQPFQAQPGAGEKGVLLNAKPRNGGGRSWGTGRPAGHVHLHARPAAERVGKLAPHARIINRLENGGQQHD